MKERTMADDIRYIVNVDIEVDAPTQDRAEMIIRETISQAGFRYMNIVAEEDE